ncbi:TRAP transporter small permease subunit [Sneathiella sp.]|uniref:TRAP transporter small permease subunit n=1 Tax=Sneathiella sp. TaxID=1964365 RepID=UPI002FDF8AAF
MKKFTATVSTVFAWAGGALILLCSILVSLDVLTRKLLGWTYFESFELSTYAFAIAVSLGCAYALISKSHIRIEVLYRLLPDIVQRVLDLVSILGLLVGATVLVWYAWSAFDSSLILGARSNTPLSVPLVIPQGLWLIGLVWFALSAAFLFLRALIHFFTGRHDEIIEDIGIASMEEEIEASTDLQTDVRVKSKNAEIG